jgi:predicted RNA-binding protein
MSSEMSNWKAFPMIFVILFGFAGLGGIIMLSRTLWEKYIPPALRRIRKTPVTLPTPGKGENLHWTSQIVLIAFVIVFATAFIYFGKTGIVNGNEIETVRGLIINNPVTLDHTSGKNKSYYYVFTFREHQNEFRFYDNYYKYSKYPLNVSTFNEGDTISIQIFREDWQSLINSYDNSTVKVINVARRNTFFIDHAFRNAQLKKDHASQLKYGLIFLGIMLLVKVLWIGSNFIQNKRQV